MGMFCKMSDYEKEIYLEMNFRELSLKTLKELLKEENFEDFRVRNRTVYNIISSISKLTTKDIIMLKQVFNIDLTNIESLLCKINFEISDLIDFYYDNEDEIYYIKKNKLSEIVCKLNTKIEIENAISLWNKNRNRILFKKNMINIDNYEELKQFKENENNYYDVLYACSSTIEDKKNILVIKYFNYNLKHIYKILNNIKKHSLENKITDYLYLKNIVECSNENELNNIYYKLIENNSLVDEIENDFIRFCFEDIANTINAKNTTKQFTIKDDVQIFDLSDTKFNLLIHRINAVANNIEIDPLKWNENDIVDGKTTISCSAISNLYLGRVEADFEQPTIYFGFKNIGADDILDMGPCNINMSDAINDSMPDSKYGNDFMFYDELIENSFDQYNEIALFRKNQITGEKIKPAYLVCFDNIEAYHMDIARKMKLPIYFIDTKKVYKTTREKLDEMIQDNSNYQSIEANFSLAKKILSFAYGAFCSGRLEINEMALFEFLNKTKLSKLDDKYKTFITQFCFKKNNDIGFGLGDKYQTR